MKILFYSEFHETCHSVTLIVLVNSHQRWKQTLNCVCFHLWCELTLALWCHSIVWSLFSWTKCSGMISFMGFMYIWCPTVDCTILKCGCHFVYRVKESFIDHVGIKKQIPRLNFNMSCFLVLLKFRLHRLHSLAKFSKLSVEGLVVFYLAFWVKYSPFMYSRIIVAVSSCS